MMHKELVNSARIRRLPTGFGWVDHRLVRKNYIGNFSVEALALYLFAVTVADLDGVSWYSDRSICNCLNISPDSLKKARNELTTGGLLGYRRPYCQLFELPECEADRNSFRNAVHIATEQRQPNGTEGRGVLNESSIYRRSDDKCDVLMVGTIIEAMAGGADDD